MRILLTGSTGFIGSRLAERIEEQNAKATELREVNELHRLIRYTAGGRWNFYAGEGVHFADLRDPDAVKEVVNEVQPQVIIHLAADSAVAFSFQRPRDVFAVNALGTIALAEAATELKDFKMFVHASTSEVYGNQGHFPIEEDARLNATSPYAAAKIAAEEYLRVQNLSYGLPILIVRPFNTYGRAPIGNQHFVVERAIVQALKEHQINLHNPEPQRDFLFREDHVQFYVDVLKKLDDHHMGLTMTVNVASGNAWSIREMAETVANTVQLLTEKSVPIHFKNVPDRPHDILRLQGRGNVVAKFEFGWEPKYTLEAGIMQAVKEWQEKIYG